MKKLTFIHLIGFVIECAALVFFALCIATDINDKLFLPLAFCLQSIGFVTILLIQRRAKSNKRI